MMHWNGNGKSIEREGRKGKENRNDLNEVRVLA